MNRAQALTDSKRTWLFALAIAIATVILYLPAIHYDYLGYDDGIYVCINQNVLKGLSKESFSYAFTSTDGGSWMPLTWLSHMCDVSLFGPKPEGAHAVNIVIHSLSACILLLALWKMTKEIWPAMFVAAAFALHPLRNESVVWISERKDVLSIFFVALGLLAYARYAERPHFKRYLPVTVCMLLGLMAKPTLVTFPFLLLLLDFWPLTRLGRDWPSFRERLWPCIKEKGPLFLLSASASILTYWAQYSRGAVQRTSFSLPEQLTTVAGNYWFYIKKIFVPIGLSVIHPPSTISTGTAAFIFVCLIVASALVAQRAFRQPFLAAGWFWFLGGLVPMIGFVRIGHVSAAERYTYLPSIGLMMAIAWGVATAVNGRIALQKLAVALAGLVVVTWAVMARADLPRWANTISLFEAAIQVGEHPVSYNNLAAGYLAAGRYNEVIEASSRAIEMDPGNLKAYVNRITACTKLGLQQRAKDDLVYLLKVEPSTAEGYTMRGETLLNLGRYADADSDFTTAIQLAPSEASGYNNRATARFAMGDYSAAIADSHKALELKPRYANAYSTLGNIYNRMGNYNSALENYTRAIQIDPSDPLPFNNRAAVLLALKRYDEASMDLQMCRRLGGQPHEGLVRAISEAKARN